MSSRFLIAYTDASISSDGQGTGAIMFMDAARSSHIHALHVLNLGKRSNGNFKLELEMKVAALHLAKPETLASIISDSQPSVDVINAFIKGQSGKNTIRRHLDEPSLGFFKAGLKRHPNVTFFHNGRKGQRMKLVDSFSRSAALMSVGKHQFIPDQGLKLDDQTKQLRRMIAEYSRD